MDIKWSYYLIALIYVLVIVLRLINKSKSTQFKKEHPNFVQCFTIKKDFFTTVAIICIIVTLLINIAALIGEKSMNGHSIMITLLVIGFTIINSFSNILLDESGQIAMFCGYTLESGEIEAIKFKNKNNRTVYDITFTKEVDSYNYAKLIVFGKDRDKLQEAFNSFVKKEELHN